MSLTINTYNHLAKYAAVMLLCFSFTLSYAQDGEDDGLDNQIIIEKDAKTTVESAKKIEFNTKPVEDDLTKVKVKYYTPTRLMEIDYTPNPLKPLSIKPEKRQTPKNSYIKLGFGSLLSPLAELGYHNSNTENLNYGAFYNHLSAKGGLEHQKFSNNDGGIYADYNFEKVAVGGDFRFDQDVHHFYGYNNEDTTFEKKKIQQKIRVFEPSIYLKTNSINKNLIDFKQRFSFYYLADKDSLTETNFTSHTSGSKIFKNKHYVSGYFKADASNLKRDTADFKKKLFYINGGYTFDNDDWKLTAGLTAVVENKTFHLFPNFVTEKRLYKHHLVFYSGWKRELQKNSYRSLVTENPYIQPDVEIKNTRVENRIAGFKGTYKNFSYDLKFANKVAKHVPFFITDSTDTKRFVTVYDKNTTITNLHAEFAYDYKERVRVGILNDYFIYEPDENAKAWHKPSLKSNLFVHYNLKNKIILKADIFALAGAHAYDPVTNSPQKIKSIIDGNLEANYLFSDYLVFYLSVNNIANTKYERWKNYPSYGLNGMIGFKFSY